jgi:hypothetical protein
MKIQPMRKKIPVSVQLANARYKSKMMCPIQTIINSYSCCRTAMGVGQRALSLSAHMAGDPPPPLLALGRVTSPCQLIGV